MIAKSIDCPYCNVKVDLTEEDLKKKSKVCLVCKKTISLKDFKFVYSNLVTIYIPFNEADRLLIVSLLESNGIKCFSKGAGVQNLFGWGQTGTGFNVVTGPVEIQVLEEDVEKAREVLDCYLSDAQSGLSFEVPSICPACHAPTNQQSKCPDCGLNFAPDD